MLRAVITGVRGFTRLQAQAVSTQLLAAGRCLKTTGRSFTRARRQLKKTNKLESKKATINGHNESVCEGRSLYGEAQPRGRLANHISAVGRFAARVYLFLVLPKRGRDGVRFRRSLADHTREEELCEARCRSVKQRLPRSAPASLFCNTVLRYPMRPDRSPTQGNLSTRGDGASEPHLISGTTL